MTTDEAYHLLDKLLRKGSLDEIAAVAREFPGILFRRWERGRTSLHLACENRGASSLDILRFLIEQGVAVDARDDHGARPLHVAACGSGGIATIPLLLEKGADVNATDHRGVTALHCATYLTPDYAAALLRHGARADATDARGDTPILWALQEGTEGVARFLWNHGARHDIFAASGLGFADVVRRLLDTNPDLARAKDHKGRTALHWAARREQIETAQLLIERGALVDQGDDKGRSPLHEAAVQCMTKDMISLLLTHGADPDATDHHGSTPLHIAARRGQPDLVGRLMAGGADTTRMNAQGLTPLKALMKTLDEDLSLAEYVFKNYRRIRAQLEDRGEVVYILLTNANRMAPPGDFSPGEPGESHS